MKLPMLVLSVLEIATVNLVCVWMRRLRYVIQPCNLCFNVYLLIVLNARVRCNNFSCYLLQELKNLNLEVSKEEVVRYSKFFLRALLPFLKQLDEEQMMEREIEARRKGKHFFCLKYMEFI